MKRFDISLAHVDTDAEYKISVLEAMDRNFIGQSMLIDKFEAAFADWMKVPHAIAVSSGTMADTIALAVLKNTWPTQTQVIMPALTFVAQLNAVLYNGLTPVFVDVKEDMQMDLEQVASKINSKTLCIFPVHLLGKPVNMIKLKSLSNALHIPIVEDTCEAMGALHATENAGLKYCGTFGAMGTFSFYPSHTLTTGEGGMIIAHDKDFADLARQLRNHGKRANSQDFRFDYVGFNGKMGSLQAAYGLVSLKRAARVIAERRETFFELGGHENSLREHISPHAFPHMAKSKEDKEMKLAMLREAGIECRNIFSCLPTQEPPYEFLGYRLGRFPVAESIGDRGLYVPCHRGVSKEAIQFIKGVFNETQIKEKAETEVLV